MINIYIVSVALMFVTTISKAQTAMQFSGVDCNNNQVNLFNDLNAGKAVVLFFYMPNCGTCPPPAQKIQTMANRINVMYPGMVKGYAFPYQNSTTCTYSASWVNNNNLSTLFTPMDSGATQVAYYGGFGMPTVVLLGGSDHRVMFSTLSFSTSDTTIMRDSILALFGTGASTNTLPSTVSSFSMFPNPADDIVTLNIELNKTSDLLIVLTDVTGKQISIINNQKQSGIIEKRINTESLPDGNYFIQLQVNGESVTKKLSVKH